jgi:hypothetical protein
MAPAVIIDFGSPLAAELVRVDNRFAALCTSFVDLDQVLATNSTEIRAWVM